MQLFLCALWMCVAQTKLLKQQVIAVLSSLLHLLVLEYFNTQGLKISANYKLS